MNSNRIIIDTTYILPLFGIKIKNLNDLNKGIKLIFGKEKQKFKVFLPSICLIEVMYKLIREYRKIREYDILKRYPLVIPTLSSSPNLTIFNPYLDSAASQFAIKLKHAGHADLFDCWIAGTAISHDGILLTEDGILSNQLKNLPESKLMTIWSWKEFIDTYL